MAHIYSLSINHFRGIDEFYTEFKDEKCVVLIGRGDSGKSTILKAISLVLAPIWNPNISDYDFNKRDLTKPIIIEAIVKDIPDKLLALGKFGEYYQILKEGVLTSNIEEENVSPQNIEKVLKIRFCVDESLEPQWCVVSDREIGDKVISHSDRALLNMFMVSDYVDSHFSYSKGSPLYATFTSKIAKDNRNSLNRVLKDIVREAYEHIKDTSEFDNFKTVTDTIRGNALDLGLTLSDLQTILEYKDNTYTDSNISLHTDGVPFRLQGKGSKRLLSIAIQYGLVQDGGIVLIDEIEQGLEPDRIRNLTNILAHSTKGQVFITTHSRDVVLEPTADQIFLMKKGAKSLQNFDKELQGTLRSKPEAFFAKRIISCEGATEEGIIRSFGKHLRETENCGLESKGIVHIDGGGSNKFYDLGIKFNNLGFDTLVFCDDDNREVDDDKKTAIAMGVNVTLCEGELAIEDQLFKDLPWTAVCELIEYAIREHAGEKQILPCEGCSCATVEELRNIPKSNQYDIRIALGRKAKSKKGAWFKNINHGEFLGEKWVEYLGQLDRDSRLYQEYKEIVNWIQHV